MTDQDYRFNKLSRNTAMYEVIIWGLPDFYRDNIIQDRLTTEENY